MITDSQYQAAMAAARKKFKELQGVRSKICVAFFRYHKANPDVYKELIKLVKEARRAGYDKWGIKAAFEVARWERRLDVNTRDKFKLSNEYGAYYSRLIMMQEPEFFGYLITKNSEADHELGWNQYKMVLTQTAKKPVAAASVPPAYPSVAI
jgi:hypothetical protein